ncbi:type II secretion system F family protein [Gemmatimonas sp. UBA7669]|uniref:type II secretion system F family protein n=1 Tax=Gemmatimonas sp. UBA7669 TaxID=1946568 RepID=UPI0025B9AAAD|nr:type II secretion system F family protein [Gemmatimonas sp. UBA7669]
MTALVLTLVFLGAMLLVVGTFVFINRRRLAAADAARIRVGDTGGILRGEVPLSILRDDRVSDVKALDTLLSGKDITVRLERELAHAGSRQKPGEFLLFTLLSAMIGLTLAQFVFGGIASVVGVLLGAPIPWLMLRRRQGIRRRQFENAFPDALDLMTNALRAGYSLQAAMEFVGRESQAPLRQEFLRFYDEQRLGVDVRTALLAMQERIGTEEARLFVTSLIIQRETGGNLVELLTNISNLIRERLEFQANLATLTAEPKMSARVLAAMPFVMFFAIYAINAQYMQPLFVDPVGKLLVVYAVVSVIVGYIIMDRIASIDL